MTNLIVSALFTKNTGAPATGELLTDIDLILRSVNKTNLAVVDVWNTENPTSELGDGRYGKLYTDADLFAYDYIVFGEYVGATVLDVDYVYGSTELPITYFPEGSVDFTYTITDSVSGLPIFGVQVWFTTDIAGSNVIWSGNTNAFGVAVDVNGNLPALDPGTYYVWRQKAGYIFDDPDTEVVT